MLLEMNNTLALMVAMAAIVKRQWSLPTGSGVMFVFASFSYACQVLQAFQIW